MAEEPETGELSVDELAALAADAVRRDRIALFKAVHADLDKVSAALEALPYRDAREPLRLVQEIENCITDPLGEHAGDCEFCDEPVFISNDPDADVEYAGDLGWVHRTCTDRLRKESPELFIDAEDDDA